MCDESVSLLSGVFKLHYWVSKTVILYNIFVCMLNSDIGEFIEFVLFADMPS